MMVRAFSVLAALLRSSQFRRISKNGYIFAFFKLDADDIRIATTLPAAKANLDFIAKTGDISRRTPSCLSMTMMPPRAGIVYKQNEGGVASCVREEERLPTPAAISKWRRSGASLPASQEVDPKISFGSGGVKASDHVADIWRQVCVAGNTRPRHTPGTLK